MPSEENREESIGRTVQPGTARILPVLGGLMLVPGAFAPLPFALATGIALNIIASGLLLRDPRQPAAAP